MEELISCTVWHFRHEERLMVKYGYDGFLEHKSEHEELIASVKTLQKRFLEEGKPVSSEDIELVNPLIQGDAVANVDFNKEVITTKATLKTLVNGEAASAGAVRLRLGGFLASAVLVRGLLCVLFRLCPLLVGR